MATAADIIFDALAENGVVGASDTVPAEDAAFCLRKLNQAVQRWSNARLMLPTLTEISVTLTGLQSYTIGPTGTTVAARPLKVVGATATDINGVSYPVKVWTRPEWDSIAVKDVTGGPPTVVWYDATNTNGRIYVYPKSDGYTLSLDCYTLLTSFEMSTSVTLPEGYETALMLTLADDIASAYGKQSKPDTRRRLAAAMSLIKATNAEPLYLSGGIGGEEFMIERGY
jgi:hypothetical protein